MVVSRRLQSIAIVGPGAIGTVLAVRLHQAGLHVTVVVRNAERAREVNRRGLVFFGASGPQHAGVEAVPIATSHELVADITCLCVKAHHTSALAHACAQLIRATPVVVSMQNGYGNTEIVAHLFIGALVGATPGFGATRISAFESRLAGLGVTHVAPVRRGAEEAAQHWCDLLEAAGLPSAYLDDFETVRWSKLALNCGINAITALHGVLNGDIVKDPQLWETACVAAEEAAAVARKQGIALVYDDVRKALRETCRATAANLSSMRQDIDAGRETEIDAINGAVVSLGRKLELPTPTNHMLLDAIHRREAQR